MRKLNLISTQFTLVTKQTLGMNNIRTLVLCSLSTILIYAGMQIFSKQLASNQPMTLLAGFIGSHIFVFVLTVSYLFVCLLVYLFICEYSRALTL